jgi:hypothetical protein
MRRIVLVSSASGEMKESLEKYRDRFLDRGDTSRISRPGFSMRIYSTALWKTMIRAQLCL